MSAIAPANRPRFRVVGSAGVFESVGLDPQEAQSIAGLKPTDEGFGLHPDGRTAVVRRPEGTETICPLRAGRHLTFYEEVAASLTLGTALPIDPCDAVRCLQLISDAQAAVASRG